MVYSPQAQSMAQRVARRRACRRGCAGRCCAPRWRGCADGRAGQGELPVLDGRRGRLLGVERGSAQPLGDPAVVDRVQRGRAPDLDRRQAMAEILGRVLINLSGVDYGA